MPKIITDSKKIKELLERGVEEVIVKEDLEKALKSGKQLRVKFGIDPTAPDIHLGHTVPLRKLKAFQDLGHKAILLIGDFTATIGDPSGKDEMRKPLSEADVNKNLKTYLKQINNIIDVKKAEIRFNKEWYGKWKLPDFYNLTSKITIRKALERDDFKKRMSQDKDISMLEIMYPLLQGYDSVALKSDVEIGGTDQKFNLLMGRIIQRRFDQPEQNILTTWLIEGTDGAHKMSKSLNNYIGISEEPRSMFGKIMSIPDNLIVKYFEALTDIEINELNKIKKEINPRDAKLKLAEEIVKIYHGPKSAVSAREEFINIFSKKEKPQKIKEIKSNKSEDLVWVLMKWGCKSKSNAWRLIKQGGVKINDKKEIDPKKQLNGGEIIQIGKKDFVKFVKK